MKLHASWRILVVGAVAVAGGFAAARPQKPEKDEKAASAKNEKEKPAFFHQFLIPGDSLDEKLLAQEKRVEEDPDSAPLRNDFGNLLAERRFPKEAREQYRKALKLDREFFLPAYNLGLMEETEGRLGAAVSAYREAIHRRRGFPPAHFRLGRVYEQQGRNELAVEEYAKAIRIDGGLRDPRRNPLVVDSRLMDRASLVNYSRDVARASQKTDASYVDVERFRPVPVTRPLASDEVVEETGPQTIEVTGPRSTAPNRAAPGTPGRAGTMRRIAPRPAPQPGAVPPQQPAATAPPQGAVPPPTLPSPPPPAPEVVPTPEPEPQR